MKKILFAALLLPVIAINSCSSTEDKKSTKENYIRVGIVAGPERTIAEVAKNVAKGKYGLDVELVTFNDYVLPNESLHLGDIDVNVFQHQPYLLKQSSERGYRLKAVARTFIYPIVGYSKKIKKKEDIKKADVIVIPNDPTNGGRALLLLQRHGLIALKKDSGLNPKVTDIIANPLELVIKEIEAPQLPGVLDDRDVVLAIINSNFAANAHLDVEQLGVIKEDEQSPYVNLIVARVDNKDAANVKKFVAAYQSEAVDSTARKLFKSAVVKGW